MSTPGNIYPDNKSCNVKSIAGFLFAVSDDLVLIRLFARFLHGENAKIAFPLRGSLWVSALPFPGCRGVSYGGGDINKSLPLEGKVPEQSGGG